MNNKKRLKRYDYVNNREIYEQNKRSRTNHREKNFSSDTNQQITNKRTRQTNNMNERRKITTT